MKGLHPGDHVNVKTRTSSFRAPEDSRTSMLLIAGGVGISPMKG